MNKSRPFRFPLPAPPEDNSGGGSPDPNAWKVSLSGGNADYAKALEPYADPGALLAKLTAEPEKPDWRKVIAGESADDLKLLEGVTDPAMFLKRYKDTQTALRNTNQIKVPGENATPEEIAAFTKALGVPEKPDGYQISAKPPEGLEIGDGDKKTLSTITNRLHEALAKGAKPADIVNLSHQIYYDMLGEAVVADETRAADLAAEGEKANRELWGSEYENNIKLAATGLREYFPGDAKEFEAFAGRRFADGTAFFDDPMVQRMFAQIARDRGEDPVFNAMRSADGGLDVDKRIADIQKLRNGTPADREKYAAASAPGGELTTLLEAKERRGAAKAR